MRDETDTAPSGPFAAIIERFPDMNTLAKTMGVPHSTVAAWKRRDSIPEARWQEVADAAKALKVTYVSYKHLAEASAAKRRMSR